MNSFELLRSFIDNLMATFCPDKYYRLEEKENPRKGKYLALIFYTKDYTVKAKDKLYTDMDVLDKAVCESRYIHCFRRQTSIKRYNWQYEEWSIEGTMELFKRMS